MACKTDVTDKVKDNKVASEELALNIKRLRELTRDLENATDCDAIKLYVELIGAEIKELTADIKKEAKKILDKYLPILKIPTNPLKLIPWVKKLVTGTITPQLEAYIKLLKQIIELVQAINQFIQAVQKVLPRLKKCAVDELEELKDEIVKDIKDTIQKEVDKIAASIKKEVNDAICESGLADLITTVKDAVKLTEDLVDELKTTKDLVNDSIAGALTSIGNAGSAISGLTGVPFEVDTSTPEAFVASVQSGAADQFSAAVNEFISLPPPVNTTVPSLSGSAIVGQTLTVNTGTWTGSNVAYSYSWFRNDQPIYGANASTYVPTSNDVGYGILCSVSADNPAGGDIANTVLTANVTSNAPVCSVLPAISGSANTGQTLTISTGTWTNSPTFTYQWMWSHIRASIHNANTNSYTIGTEDAGHALTCLVTATSSGGSNSVHATSTAIVSGAGGGGGGGDTNLSLNTFTGNGSNTIFTLSYESSTNNSIVIINGAVQKPTTDYTVAAQTLTFTEAPYADDEIVVRYIAI